MHLQATHCGVTEFANGFQTVSDVSRKISRTLLRPGNQPFPALFGLILGWLPTYPRVVADPALSIQIGRGEGALLCTKRVPGGGEPRVNFARRACVTWFKLRLIITITGSARWLLRAVKRYHWDTRTVEFDLSRPLFLS